VLPQMSRSAAGIQRADGRDLPGVHQGLPKTEVDEWSAAFRALSRLQMARCGIPASPPCENQQQRGDGFPQWRSAKPCSAGFASIHAGAWEPLQGCNETTRPSCMHMVVVEDGMESVSADGDARSSRSAWTAKQCGGPRDGSTCSSVLERLSPVPMALRRARSEWLPYSWRSRHGLARAHGRGKR